MRVDGRTLRDIWNGSVLRACACEPCDGGADQLDVVRVGADLNVCYAWNHRRDVDRYEQVIWACVRIVKDVWAADVRVDWDGEEKQRNRERREYAHRFCMRCGEHR